MIYERSFIFLAKQPKELIKKCFSEYSKRTLQTRKIWFNDMLMIIDQEFCLIEITNNNDLYAMF